MKRFRVIDKLLSEAFALNLENNPIGACDKWLEAWTLIKELFTEGIASDIFDLSGKYKWNEFPGNHMQYLEMELHNAGLEDETYFRKRIDFCRELMQWCGDEDLTINNTRIALGEAHYWSGDELGGEKIFKEWIEEDPDCGWAYSGWAGCYSFNKNGSQYDRAEDILLSGYTRSNLRDGKYVVDGLIRLYEETGNSIKLEELKKKHPESQHHMPENIEIKKSEPIRVVKVGRNEPCPCGSGKKYKKCCLS